ncbi:MAG: hypothetical protein R3C27_14400 [Hyphomonadaceae bacterium]
MTSPPRSATRALGVAIDRLVKPHVGADIDKVAGIEARGFVLGGAVAHQLAVGFAPVHKKELPWRTLHQEYQLEYGVDSYRDARGCVGGR